MFESIMMLAILATCGLMVATAIKNLTTEDEENGN